ncbi:MAG: cation transporter [Polyangiaceae bacterium]|nr:cation transporter [Polyangiaceae bacterium]
MSQQSQKLAIARLSVLSNTLLMVSKLAIGLVIGSVSVLSEAIHSGVDLLAAAIAFFAVRESGRPEDQQHAFGHGKVENLSALAEAILIFVAAGWIVYEAIHKLLRPAPIDAPWAGVLVMGVSSAVNAYVSARLFAVARETESSALEADAWHLRTDVYTSVGVMVGLGLVWLGGLVVASQSVMWLDPVVAMIVAAFIVRAAWHLSRDAIGDLMDTQLPQNELDAIAECLGSIKGPLHSYHGLKTRRAGPTRFVELHLEVPKTLSVEEAHRVADEVEQSIQKRLRSVSVTTHVEPISSPPGPGTEPGVQARSDPARDA